MERIRQCDLVEVIAGKEKGKRARVLRVLHKKDRVVLERLQMVKRHTKPTQANQQGGIVEKEGSVHISNVMPIDPGSDKPTRIRVTAKDGVRVRVGKSGSTIEVEKK